MRGAGSPAAIVTASNLRAESAVPWPGGMCFTEEWPGDCTTCHVLAVGILTNVAVRVEKVDRWGRSLGNASVRAGKGRPSFAARLAERRPFHLVGVR
jgi:hypothetical protein